MSKNAIRKSTSPKAKSTKTQAPKQRVRKIREGLAKLYPHAHCALHYANPLELMIATILSAQCTDERVNKVTPALFKRYATAKAYAESDQAELESMIRSSGFFRNKATNIRANCKALVEKHGGQVPRTMEELVPLPGVGRKTANVILGNAFGIPGIPVDTHVGRLSRRMGLTENEDPVKVEADLMELIPKDEWTMFGHQMIFHGRQICQSRKPKCDECILKKVCPKIGVES
jgi:endonuclease-3